MQVISDELELILNDFDGNRVEESAWKFHVAYTGTQPGAMSFPPMMDADIGRRINQMQGFVKLLDMEIEADNNSLDLKTVEWRQE